MSLTQEDRDALLIDILEALTHLASLLEFEKQFSARVLHNKASYYREKMNSEFDLEQEKDKIPPPPKVPVFAALTTPSAPNAKAEDIDLKGADTEKVPPNLSSTMKSIKQEGDEWAKEQSKRVSNIEGIIEEELRVKVK